MDIGLIELTQSATHEEHRKRVSVLRVSNETPRRKNKNTKIAKYQFQKNFVIFSEWLKKISKHSLGIMVFLVDTR